ncbi:DUF3341 domain-containing protein [Gracilimonas mengyeensis]|uniref:Quinol:cytochrome c oxidoreductase membrane protein n=1 Tax=Gracilimonas mengyeensis TaxID=1302730 RepID=A0A521BAQ2_9BACT|nr:DUF3341 domain-containing protein [Gracilimonas mengyeensis]SMO44153.1 quinol:cytochrome c oxidoreductase membrane protein [Gracilimonas mengyeensis]
MSTTEEKELHGILAEFKNPKELTDVAKVMSESGYKQFDTFSPFPIHGMDKAMKLEKSKLGWIVLGHGLVGFTGAIAMMYFMSVVDYPINISGKPFLNAPAWVPITFELTVLLSAFGAVFGMFFLNGLPKLHNPLFNSKRFKKVTDDGFFACIEADDKLFETEKVKALFEEAGATHIEEVYD